ncbi:unnamed protein product [Protopolystoma xenopodis]|uniref:Uncharacterized protein n=1 Tax=Protopolystoma xenopodis TaxID=117903 RepID=A0A448XFT7_9PLAT|nr:unnamed protein product [Protopolystoma xenopodis]
MLAFNFFTPSWALLLILHVSMSLLADAVHLNNTQYIPSYSAKRSLEYEAYTPSPTFPTRPTFFQLLKNPACKNKFEIRPYISAIGAFSRVYYLCVRPRGPMPCDMFSSNEIARQKRGLSRAQSGFMESYLTKDDPHQLGEQCRLEPMQHNPDLARLYAERISDEMLLRMRALENIQLNYNLGSIIRQQIYKQIWALYKDVLNWICHLKLNMSLHSEFEGRLRMEMLPEDAGSGKSRLMLHIQLSDQPGDIVHVPLVQGFPFLDLVVKHNERFTGLKSTSANISCRTQFRIA